MVQSTIHDLPPFPSGLPVARIARISSQKLFACDPDEGARVLEAAQSCGFFYLDLQDSPEGRKLLQDSEELLVVAKTAFGHPVEDKLQFMPKKGTSLFGYKPAGTVKQTDKDARPDTTEFLNVSKDHLHGVVASRSYPFDINKRLPLLKEFTREGHECGMVVLRTLARQLGLRENVFTDLNLFDQPSGDHCRLTRQMPHPNDANAIGFPSHTDFGSVTILFNWLGGLQMESPAEPGSEFNTRGKWEWVKPIAGHAIVNLGDAMVTFTNGALKSGKHRVVPPPGDQGVLERYSVVYFVRPHDAAMMKPIGHYSEGTRVKVGGKFLTGHNDRKVFTAGEWILQRAIQLGN